MSVIAQNKFRVSPRRDNRILILTALFFLLGAIIVGRFFNLQVRQHDYYLGLAKEGHSIYQELMPERGVIYVRERNELYPIVANKDYYSVYADPRQIKDVKVVIDKVTPILGLKEEEWQALIPKLKKTDDPYEPIKNKVTRSQVEEIKKLELPGIDYKPEPYRYYPEANFSGQVLGFIGFSGEEKQGNYGLEGYFDQELAGQRGMIQSIKDAWGSLITVGDRKIEKAVDGADLVLTADRTIQVTACQKIKDAVAGFEAEGGTVIVMEPNTGAIIAMCSWPNFDPDKYNEVEDINVYNNRAIFYDYEPGSVFKAFTMAAGIDLGLVTPETTYEDTGEIKIIGQKPIRNSDLKAYGVQTMTQVLEKSLNTGAVFVVDKLGKENFREYVKKFGFGKITGITLSTEVPGNIANLDKKGEIYSMTASFGQGITVTPLQLVSAFTALANGGKLMKPYFVDEIINSDGSTIKTQPQVVSQVISPRTAATIKGMLTSVVENGWGKKAGVAGYYVGGKTGTAQVAAGGGYGSETMHTFIGFAPVSAPKFVMLVLLDKPKKVKFSADSATTIFGQIAKFILEYYQVPPER